MAQGEGTAVMLRITSLQIDEQGEEERISLETPGRRGRRGGADFLTYEETELTGMKGTRTTLFLYPDHVVLVRTGTFMQRQEYREGEETSSLCETPLGYLEMRVRTDAIERQREGTKERLSIRYTVELLGLFTHENQIVIDVWEDKGIHGSQRGIAADH